MRQWVHVLLLGVILSAGAWLSLKDLTFFSPDTGLRYLQVRAFEEHGWRQGAVAYAGLQFDPGMRFVPYYHAYTRYGDGFLLLISLFFPLAVAAMHSLFGPIGIVVVPVIGTLVTAAAVAGLWQLAGLRHSRWMFWGTALATPMLFYSLTLWDHTIGVGLSTLAVYAGARSLRDDRLWWPLAAGLLISLAVVNRQDVAPMVVSLGIAILVTSWPRWQPLLIYGTGGMLGLLVTAPLNLLWAGHPLGLVIAQPYLGYLSNVYNPFIAHWDSIELTRASVATRQLLAVEGGQPVTLFAALLLIVGSFLLTLVLRLPRLWRRSTIYLSLGLIILGTFFGMLPARYGQVNGMLTTLPLFGLALAYVDGQETKSRTYHFVFVTAWLYVILTLAALRAPGGVQWGGRYLLPAVPLIFFLALYGVVAYSRVLPPAAKRALQQTAAVLVIASLLIQVAGVRVLYLYKADLKQWKDILETLPAEVLITSNSRLASLMAGLETKVFLYAEDDTELNLIVQRLATQGVEMFAFVPFPVPPDPGEEPLPERIHSVSVQQERTFLYRIETGEP